MGIIIKEESRFLKEKGGLWSIIRLSDVHSIRTLREGETKRERGGAADPDCTITKTGATKSPSPADTRAPTTIRTPTMEYELKSVLDRVNIVKMVDRCGHMPMILHPVISYIQTKAPQLPLRTAYANTKKTTSTLDTVVIGRIVLSNIISYYELLVQHNYGSHGPRRWKLARLQEDTSMCTVSTAQEEV